MKVQVRRRGVARIAEQCQHLAALDVVAYAHLERAGLQVRVGGYVKRGQVLALLGNSGNTTAPHLHFHVSHGIGPLSSQGVPYVIDGFTARGVATDVTEQGKLVWTALPPQQATQRATLPLNGYVVDFPPLK